MLTVQGKQWKNVVIRNIVKHTRKTQNRQKSIFTFHSAGGKRLACHGYEGCHLNRIKCVLYESQLHSSSEDMWIRCIQNTAAIVQKFSQQSHVWNCDDFFVGASHYLTGSKWWKWSYSIKSSIWIPLAISSTGSSNYAYLNMALSYWASNLAKILADLESQGNSLYNFRWFLTL